MAQRSFGAYLSARLRGMKSRLLSQSDLDGLLEKGEGDSLSQALLTTPYGDEMAEALTRYEGANAVEDAASRNLVNTFAKLRNLCRGHYGELARLFVGRWDLIAVKSLLRNLHHGVDPETGDTSWVPGPSLPIAVMKELGSQTSMDALVRGLAAWNGRLCRPLVEALPEYQKTNELRTLEEALDRGYFSGNLRRLSSRRDGDSLFVKGLLRMEIDRINLRILFEPRSADVNPEDSLSRLLPRGTVGMTDLRAIASAPSLDRATDTLSKTPYAEFFVGLAETTAASDFSTLDRQFETAFISRLTRAAQHQSIGIAVLMRYAWLKYNEVMNIRMIARCRDIQLDPERIREELVYV